MEKELKNYTPDKTGLKKLINNYGGKAFVDEAANFANNAPKVKALFNKFNIDPIALKDNVMKNMQDESSDVPCREMKDNPAGSFKDRLSKLK